MEPFWPVVLTEMIRIFSAPEPEAVLLLAVAKFLDLVLVLTNEQFNFWEWMFLQYKHYPVFHVIFILFRFFALPVLTIIPRKEQNQHLSHGLIEWRQNYTEIKWYVSRDT